MSLTMIMAAGGSLMAGAKIYRTRVAGTQMRLADALLDKNENRGNQTECFDVKGQRLPPVQQIETLKTLYQEHLRPLFHDSRHQQLSDLAPGGTKNELSVREKKTNRNLTLSGIAWILSIGGVLIYPPLNIVALPILIFIIGPVFREIYQSLFNDRKIGVAAIDALSSAAPLVMGYFPTASYSIAQRFISRKLLLKTKDHSRNSLINIFGEQPQSVWILQNDIEVEVTFESLNVEDIIVLYAGQMIPIDGSIVAGIGQVTQSALTGESQPVEKMEGDLVLAGTVLIEGRICVRVEKTGVDTMATQIGKILEHTVDYKSSIQSKGERIVDQATVPTLVASAVALPLLGPSAATAVLYASFGYQMRLIAPISVLNFLRIASQKGILIKDGRSLELLSDVDIAVFDKTGTLTQEVPTVGKIIPAHGYNEDELLRLAAAAEYKQTHPIALAIQQEAHNRELNLPPVTETQVEVGYGLKVHLENRRILVGSQRFLAMEGIVIPATVLTIQEHAHEEGHSLVYIAIDDHLGGVIELCPTVRPEASSIINELRKRKITTYIISGDHETPTRKLTQTLGIDHYFAETLPQDKAQLIEQLQAAGKSVCFIGDGINDSIALKKANVSISMRGASAVATDTADILMMDGTLNQLIPLFDIAADMDRNFSRSTVMGMVPGIICVGGVFFFHFGLVSAILLYNLSLVMSLGNAMLPWIKHQREKSHDPQKISHHSAAQPTG